MKIQKIFTKIRNELNEREDKILFEIDKEFDKLYCKEDIIQESEKLPNKIKTSLDKSKRIQTKWKDKKNILNLLINDCIEIERNIQEINTKKENINKFKKAINYKIQFYPENDNKINEFIDNIKNFGNITSINYMKLFTDSLIIKGNKIYLENIINWINPQNVITTDLLYRKSRDGESYETFHNLCDDQGATLVLIKSDEECIIGGFTPLNWDNKTEGWKNDFDTFIFNLSDNREFRKISSKTGSIYCGKEQGPWFPFIGFRETGKKNMNQGEFLFVSDENDCFKDFKEIIPHEKKNRFFDVEEVEVYRIGKKKDD